MGCNISRPELRGRGKDPGLLSFNNHNADEAPRKDPIYATTQPAVSAKVIIKQIVGRNSDVSMGKGKKDFVLGGSNELLLPEKDKEGLTDHSPPPPSHVSSLHDAATRKSPDNALADSLKHPKTNHNHPGNDVVDSEGRGALIPEFEGPLWISSPSFRDYCKIAPLDANSDDNDDGFRISVAKDNNDNDVENRSHRENLTHLTKDTEVKKKQNHTDVSKDTEGSKIDENTIQRNDSTIQVVKRRRNLRKVLTLHRQAAVRNLFSVGTCYNPLASSAHNGARKPPHSKPV